MSLHTRGGRVDPAVLLDPIARDSARSYSTVDAVTAIEGIEVEGTIDEVRHRVVVRPLLKSAGPATDMRQPW